MSKKMTATIELNFASEDNALKILGKMPLDLEDAEDIIWVRCEECKGEGCFLHECDKYCPKNCCEMNDDCESCDGEGEIDDDNYLYDLDSIIESCLDPDHSRYDSVTVLAEIILSNEIPLTDYEWSVIRVNLSMKRDALTAEVRDQKSDVGCTNCGDASEGAGDGCGACGYGYVDHRCPECERPLCGKGAKSCKCKKTVRRWNKLSKDQQQRACRAYNLTEGRWLWFGSEDDWDFTEFTTISGEKFTGLESVVPFEMECREIDGKQRLVVLPIYSGPYIKSKARREKISKLLKQKCIILPEDILVTEQIGRYMSREETMRCVDNGEQYEQCFVFAKVSYPPLPKNIFRWQTGEAMYEAGILNNVIGAPSIRESVVRKTLCKSATPYGKRMFEAVLQRLKDLGVIEAVPHGLKRLQILR